MISHLLTMVLTLPDSTGAGTESWQGPTAVYGAVGLLVGLAAWMVKQAFGFWSFKNEFVSFRDTVLGNVAKGTTGIIPELRAEISKIGSAQHEQVGRMDKLAEAIRERPWCGERRREVDAKLTAFDKLVAEVPTRGTVNQAFDQLRALEKTAADDRQKFAVAMERVEGVLERYESVLQRLENKIDILNGEPVTASMKPVLRTKTNPPFDPNKR